TQNGLYAGSIADFTCYSFHAVKNLTTAEGGAVTWKATQDIDDEEIYKQYQLLSLHGQTKDALHKNQLGAWEYDIVSPAYKCNMTDIMAAIGLVQLDRYEEMLKWRHEIISRYDEAFKDLPVRVLNHHNDNHISSGHLYFIRINGINEEKRNEIIIKMAEKGIACNVHYKPLPMMSAYKNRGFDIKDYPHAYHQYENQITLPLYSKLTIEDVEYIIRCFKKSLEECKCC
ncbi:MAG: DegT/DnrJ/EryC1/StrS family aminotransferase, partial [Coprobacillus cateniformis]